MQLISVFLKKTTLAVTAELEAGAAGHKLYVTNISHMLSVTQYRS